MFVFIFCNVVIGFLIQSENRFYSLLQSDLGLYIGLILMSINFVAAWVMFKKIPYKLRYDLFAVGALLTWVGYWPPFFRVGSPLFYYYSLYFAFAAAFFGLVFIRKLEFMESDEINWLQWLSDSGRFNPVLIMMAVMASLYFPQHFILFPITMTLLLIRYALACCLDNE